MESCGEHFITGLVNVVTDRVNKIYQLAVPEDPSYLVSSLNDSVAVAFAVQMDVPTLKKTKKQKKHSLLKRDLVQRVHLKDCQERKGFSVLLTGVY